MQKFYIKVIVEGNEEEMFFSIVKELGTNDIFYLDIENSGGYGGIGDCFLSALREGDLYDCILCVYDVDNKIGDPKSPYNLTRSQLNLLFGDEEITDKVSFCTNPNILQLILLFADKLDNVKLNTTSKTTNTKLVHNYWPEIASEKLDDKGRKIKSDYNASSWQLEIIKYSILNGAYSYDSLFDNAHALPDNYKKLLPSSNVIKLLIALKDGDKEFFNSIRDAIETID